MEHDSLEAGSAESGSFIVTAEFQQISGAYAGRSGVVLGMGAAGNLACFEWLRNLNGLLKKAGYDKGAPYPTLAPFQFGSGQVETVQHAADVPVVLAG